MTQLTEAEKEAIYDAERDGSAYVKADVWAPVLDIICDPTNDGRAHEDADEDTPISDDEVQIIRALYPDIPIVRSRDAAHRQDRWNAILDRVADMDEPEKSEAIGYMEGLLDGMLMKREPAA